MSKKIRVYVEVTIDGVRYDISHSIFGLRENTIEQVQKAILAAMTEAMNKHLMKNKKAQK